MSSEEWSQEKTEEKKNENSKSEWNDHASFSYQMNEYRRGARMAHLSDDLMGWSNYLWSLRLHVWAVLSATERTNLIKLFNVMENAKKEFMTTPEHLPSKNFKGTSFKTKLIELDQEIGIYCNEHLPFLRMPDEQLGLDEALSKW